MGHANHQSTSDETETGSDYDIGDIFWLSLQPGTNSPQNQEGIIKKIGVTFSHEKIKIIRQTLPKEKRKHHAN